MCFHDQTLSPKADFDGVNADVLILETTRGNTETPEGFTRDKEAKRFLDAIRAGLGEPSAPDASGDASGDGSVQSRAGESPDEGDSGGVTAEQLAVAAERLVAEAPTCTVEQLAARARYARAELDAEADASRVAEREQALRDRRYLYLSRQPDGMTRLSGLLDGGGGARGGAGRAS